jgi:hypothetical protein
MSAIPPKADITTHSALVCCGPEADLPDKASSFTEIYRIGADHRKYCPRVLSSPRKYERLVE